MSKQISTLSPRALRTASNMATDSRDGPPRLEQPVRPGLEAEADELPALLAQGQAALDQLLRVRPPVWG